MKFKFIKQFFSLSLITKFCFALLFISFFSNLFIANKMAIKGKEMMDLSDKKTKLEKEISVLSLEISTLSSFNHVESEALKLGFVEMKDPVTPIIPANVAVVTNELSSFSKN